MEDLKTIIDYMLYMGEGHFSPKQINRFLYYSYGIYVAVYNDDIDELDNKLFNDFLYTYPRGPVNGNANKYLEENRERYYMSDNSYKNTRELEYSIDKLHNKSKRVINAVLKVYGKYTDNQLEDMVLKEPPYKKCKKKDSIKKMDDKVIYDYFARNYRENYKPKRNKIFTLLNQKRFKKLLAFFMYLYYS